MTNGQLMFGHRPQYKTKSRIKRMETKAKKFVISYT